MLELLILLALLFAAACVFILPIMVGLGLLSTILRHAFPDTNPRDWTKVPFAQRDLRHLFD